MYWLRRPPYLRYLAAGVILLGAAWLELRGPALVLHPFALETVPAGASIEEGSVEWREVPAGMLPPVSSSGVTIRRVDAGHPLLPADVGRGGPDAPKGWWGLEVEIPSRAQVGQQVQLIVMGTTSSEVSAVPGVVLQTGDRTDAFDFAESPGLVAVPPDQAVLVAIASAEGRLAVLVEP